MIVTASPQTIVATSGDTNTRTNEQYIRRQLRDRGNLPPRDPHSRIVGCGTQRRSAASEELVLVTLLENRLIAPRHSAFITL